MIPAGREQKVFAWPEAPDDPRWQRLQALREQLAIRACCCSVFEACHVRDNAHREPTAVRCPVARVIRRGD